VRWDLEELTEDTLAAYLRTQVSGDMRVYVAWEVNEPEFPCAMVHAGQSGPISEEAAWHDARLITVEVAVMVEAATTNLKTARERNAEARSQVINALATSTLESELQNAGTEDIAFSMAQMTNLTRTTENRVFVTTITVEVVAEPVTGS